MFGKRRLDDFSEELRSHLAIEADRLREEGLDENEARRQARINLGNLMLQEEQFYESSRWAWLEQLRQDVRYSLRQILQAPAFAITAVLTLALGIGAPTAIFSLIHVVLLKSLPVPRPSELYMIGEAKHTGVYSGIETEWDIFSYDLYKYLRDHTSGFESLAAFQADPRRVGVRRIGDPRAAQSFGAEYVSGNYFQTFQVPAFAGRTIGEEDDRAGAPLVAMISYRAWQEHYALDPSVVGASFGLNGTAVTIIGVAPPGFFGDAVRANPPDFWLPLASEPDVNHARWVQNAQLHWLYVMGRVKSGSAIRSIEGQMQVELRQWLTQGPGVSGLLDVSLIPRQTLHLRPGGSGMGLARATYSDGLKLLLAISGFVLMIVCANMANLMLVRGIARRRQTSISLALGAARGRILRQALTESVMLGLIGGIAGIGIAFSGTRALVSSVFVGNSLPVDTTPDLTVLAFAIGVSIVTGLMFGVGPAWSATRADPIDALRGAGRSTQHSSFAQRGLVVTQAALSLVLLTAAGQLILSLRNEANQKFGFVSEGRIAVRIDPNLAGYKVDQLDALYRRIQDTLRRLPGVLNVSYALFSPMSGSNWTTDVSFEGRPPGLDGENTTSWARVGPAYFDTIGTAIVRGRPVLESDIDSTRHVAVVNEAFAQRFFPGEDPIGKHFGARPKFEKSLEIVGIAANAKYREPDQPTFPMFFLPRPQVTHYDNPGTMAFESRSLYVNDIVLHVAGANLSMEEPIRRAFAGIDPNLPIFWIQSLETAKTKQLSQQSLIARLTSLFGLTALLLASIGLYGVTTYAVAQRSKEIGIRVVLGADRNSVVGMVLRNAYVLVATGLGFGIPLAIVMGRLIRSRLFGVDWYNPTILGGAAAVLGICALLATIVPARRAASLEPLDTLRGD